LSDYLIYYIIKGSLFDFQQLIELENGSKLFNAIKVDLYLFTYKCNYKRNSQ
jgi:hypothetical protein